MPRTSRVRRPAKRSDTEPAEGSAALPPPATLYVARLVGATDDGWLLVQFDGCADPHIASHEGQVDATFLAQAVGERVPVVLCRTADALVVLGLLQPLTTPARREVHAGEQLVLRSGAASLTLTAAGKVLLRGAYVSSWSNGVNRIVGRTVRLD